MSKVAGGGGGGGGGVLAIQPSVRTGQFLLG